MTDELKDTLAEAIKGIYQQTPAGPVIREFNTIPESDFADWILPPKALNAFGLDQALATLQFERELRAGRIGAAAHQVLWVGSEAQGSVFYAVMPPWLWRYASIERGSDFWQTGYLDVTAFSTAQGYQYNTHTRFEIFDVRFEKECFVIDDSLPKKAQSQGGRPRKDWWDDLWIEMIGRMEANDLNPDTAANLQRQMEDWLGENQIYPGDSTLKPMSRKLFKYIKEARGKT